VKTLERTIYTARAGDSLSKLAAAAGVPTDALASLNLQLRRGRIAVGTPIHLPANSDVAKIHAALAAANSALFTALDSDPLHLKIAHRELGQSAKPGPANNARIVEYLQTVADLPADQQGSDETDWCAAFVNWCVKQAGIAEPRHPAAIL
jgi:hypothetical protein